VAKTRLGTFASKLHLKYFVQNIHSLNLSNWTIYRSNGCSNFLIIQDRITLNIMDYFLVKRHFSTRGNFLFNKPFIGRPVQASQDESHKTSWPVGELRMRQRGSSEDPVWS